MKETAPSSLAAARATLRVQVRYYNVLADYAGQKQVEIPVPEGCTLRMLLNDLVERNPAAFRHAVTRGGGLNPYIRVFRNERLVAGAALDQPLAEGDEIRLFPAVAGGGDDSQ